MFNKLFAWWNGATLGTLWSIFTHGRFVAQDVYGNRYFEAKTAKGSYDGRKRRWVTYKGFAEPTKIPPEWHAWMHYMTDTLPGHQLQPARGWAQAPRPNMTGTPEAWQPQGALSSTSPRAKTTADYNAWTPEN